MCWGLNSHCFHKGINSSTQSVGFFFSQGFPIEGGTTIPQRLLTLFTYKKKLPPSSENYPQKHTKCLEIRFQSVISCKNNTLPLTQTLLTTIGLFDNISWYIFLGGKDSLKKKQPPVGVTPGKVVTACGHT